MRWQQLFADLEAQLAEEESAAERREEASRVRVEWGRLQLTDRLKGSLGRPVTLTCRGAGEVAGRLVEVGVDWLLLEDGQRRDVLVATRAVRTAGGLTSRTAPEHDPGVVFTRLDLRRALRGLARDRALVHCLLDDGGVVTGTVDRVGADFLELAEHPADLPRRRSAVTGVRAVVLDAVAVVRTMPPAVV